MSASPISPRALHLRANLPSVSEIALARARAPSAARKSEDSIARRQLAPPSTLRDIARQQDLACARTRQEERRRALVSDLLDHVPAADRASARTAIPAILDAARETGTSDPNQIGYFLATAQTESDFGANMTETGHQKEWFNKTYGGEDGNRSGTNDGYAYRGRGYVQTTHAGRYAELSHKLRLADVPVLQGGKPALDRRGNPKMEAALLAHPEKLTEPRLAAQALVVGVERNLFTHDAAAAIDKTIPAGRKAGDADFYHARAIVNGIVNAQARAVASHATTYADILSGYRHSVLDASALK